MVLTLFHGFPEMFIDEYGPVLQEVGAGTAVLFLLLLLLVESFQDFFQYRHCGHCGRLLLNADRIVVALPFHDHFDGDVLQKNITRLNGHFPHRIKVDRNEKKLTNLAKLEDFPELELFPVVPS